MGADSFCRMMGGILKVQLDGNSVSLKYKYKKNGQLGI